jgi:alkylhydroperoxidase/carboxymuconolactone decarboxylase family protein YurZ
MADEKTEKRIQNFIEVMKKERGYLPAPWGYLAPKDIDFMEAYDNLYRRGLEDGKALPAKYRELVCIGILAHRGSDDAVYNHVKRALELGATKQELLDAIETTIVPGGAPTFGTGLKALMRVEEEEKKGK